MSEQTKSRRRDTDYVLGTHDDEVERLGLQHRVWRSRVYDAWRRANFTVGQTILDVGCGPGWASLDLSEIVGPDGEIISIDRSPKFLDTLTETARDRGITNITVHQTDLDTPALPVVLADGAWCRWVIGYLSKPRQLLEKLAPLLRPGARFVSYEYMAYQTWAVSPRNKVFEEFVELVTRTWRDSGGEPNIGVDIARWLPECGFRVLEMRPIVDVISPENFMWEWPASFIETGTQRLIELKAIDQSQAAAVMATLQEYESMPGARMITPTMLEIVAERV
jgi:ubiquinone/menaquinone biosynthesis C-methylase UbiE